MLELTSKQYLRQAYRLNERINSHMCKKGELFPVTHAVVKTKTPTGVEEVLTDIIPQVGVTM